VGEPELKSVGELGVRSMSGWREKASEKITDA